MEQKQIQTMKAPAAGRMRGATKEILILLERGPLYRIEIYHALNRTGQSTLQSALWTLRRYALVSFDNNGGHFLLTEEGRKYCDNFAGGARRAKALGLGESDGLHLSPPPPVQPDGAWAGREEIKHDLQREVPESVGKKLDRSCVEAVLKLDREKPAALNAPSIVRDPPADTGSIPTAIRGRSDTGLPKRFVPLSDEEKTLAFEAVRSWKEIAQPSTAEKIIISKMLSCVVFSPERPWNQKFFKDKRTAAEFFELTEGEFDEAIHSLGKGGRNFAYYYEIDGKKKAGIYVQWLELLRRGRWSSS